MFNEDLRTARSELGMSQKDMSDKLGIPFRTYQNYEYGSRVPTEFVKNSILNLIAGIKKDRS